MDNTEKNKYVKQEITKALLLLLEEKDLDDITVSELTSKAQVGRVSFYRNYKTKEDILNQYLYTIIHEWKKDTIEDNMPSDKLIERLFQHLIDHKDFYTLLYQKNLLYLFRNILKKLMVKNNELSNPEAYAVAFVSYGLYGWIEEWLARGMQESPQNIYTFLKSQSLVHPR